jgi:hypothetical protein
VARRYDWTGIRDRYVTGDEPLERIAEDPDMPAWNTLRKRSSAEGWVEQRDQYRHNVSTKTRERASTQAAEVRARHVRIARAVQAKGLEALRDLDPSKLTPYQLIRYIQAGADIERRAMNLDELNVNTNAVDWNALTVEQLKRIAAGEDPSDVLAG